MLKIKKPIANTATKVNLGTQATTAQSELCESMSNLSPTVGGNKSQSAMSDKLDPDLISQMSALSPKIDSKTKPASKFCCIICVFVILLFYLFY